MLMPRRVKRRKVQRGKMKGIASRGNKVAYGDFGLVALQPAWITSNQIEAARVAMTRYIRRGGKVWIKIFPHKPVTEKPAETRMGSGKGSPEYWVAVVKPGRVMFEIAGVSEETAKEALKRAMHKLPIKCKIIGREDEEKIIDAELREWVAGAVSDQESEPEVVVFDQDVEATEAIAAPAEEKVEAAAKPIVEKVEAVATPVEKKAQAVAAPVEKKVEAVVAPKEKASAVAVPVVKEKVEAVVPPVGEKVETVVPPVEEKVEAVVPPVGEKVEAAAVPKEKESVATPKETTKGVTGKRDEETTKAISDAKEEA